MATQKKKKKSSCLPRPETFLHYWTLLLTLLRELSLKKGKKKRGGSFYLLRWLSRTVEQETLRPNL